MASSSTTPTIINDPLYYGWEGEYQAGTNPSAYINDRPGFRVLLVLSAAANVLAFPGASLSSSILNLPSGTDVLTNQTSVLDITDYCKEVTWTSSEQNDYTQVGIVLDNRKSHFSFVPIGTTVLIQRRKPLNNPTGRLYPYIKCTVWERERTADGTTEEMTLTCYDQMYWIDLAYSKVHLLFNKANSPSKKGWTVTQIITKVCQANNIPVGTIDNIPTIIPLDGGVGGFPIRSEIFTAKQVAGSPSIQGVAQTIGNFFRDLLIKERSLSGRNAAVVLHTRDGNFNMEVSKAPTQVYQFTDRVMIQGSSDMLETMDDNFATQYIVESTPASVVPASTTATSSDSKSAKQTLPKGSAVKSTPKLVKWGTSTSLSNNPTPELSWYSSSLKGYILESPFDARLAASDKTIAYSSGISPTVPHVSTVIQTITWPKTFPGLTFVGTSDESSHQWIGSFTAQNYVKSTTKTDTASVNETKASTSNSGKSENPFVTSTGRVSRSSKVAVKSSRPVDEDKESTISPGGTGSSGGSGGSKNDQSATKTPIIKTETKVAASTGFSFPALSWQPGAASPLYKVTDPKDNRFLVYNRTQQSDGKNITYTYSFTNLPGLTFVTSSTTYAGPDTTPLSDPDNGWTGVFHMTNVTVTKVTTPAPKKKSTAASSSSAGSEAATPTTSVSSLRIINPTDPNVQKVFGIIPAFVPLGAYQNLNFSQTVQVARAALDQIIRPLVRFTFNSRGIPGLWYGDSILINSVLFGISGIFAIREVDYTLQNGQVLMQIIIYVQEQSTLAQENSPVDSDSSALINKAGSTDYSTGSYTINIAAPYETGVNLTEAQVVSLYSTERVSY